MKQPFAARTFLTILIMTTMTMTACDGCSDKPKPEADLGPPIVEDMGALVDLGPPKDDLKEARESAETKGQLRAVTLGDTARLVASQIEAAKKAPTTSSSSSTRKTRIKTPESKETGTISAKNAERVFRKFDGAMRKCYERALKKRPGLEGKVRLMVVVSAGGTVKRAKASGISMNDGGVNNCMEALTPRMKFPKPSGGAARLQKTYSFSPAI